jgi:hypothetical protein
MTDPRCDAFRGTFEPGQRGPHFLSCPDCRAWAEEVESWRSLEGRSGLPQKLRTRLLAIPAEESLRAARTSGAAPVPTKLPTGLRHRLLRIPAAERNRRRVLKARYAVAASYLLAGLFTLAAGGASSSFPAQTHAARSLARASVRSTEALREMGSWIVEGCSRANATMEKLFGRFGARTEQAPTPAAPESQKEE